MNATQGKILPAAGEGPRGLHRCERACDPGVEDGGQASKGTRIHDARDDYWTSVTPALTYSSVR